MRRRRGPSPSPRARGGAAAVNCAHSVADASSLLHHEIVVKNTQLPPLPNNRYYDFQLIGLTVFQGNHCFGHVQSIAHHPANDNLVIEKDGKINRLIPLIYDEIIQSVDLEKKTIEVNWYIESS